MHISFPFGERPDSKLPKREPKSKLLDGQILDVELIDDTLVNAQDK